VIDGFGHNGHHVDKRFGVLATTGKLTMLREEATLRLVATYCERAEGTLHICIPLAMSVAAAANDKRTIPNDGDQPCLWNK
jgi:hypothetical protein